MNLGQFVSLLVSAEEKPLVFQLPDGGRIAPHFHITEVGKVTKDFVDCGGVRRTAVACVLQTLVASDVDHRLTAGKLATIMKKARVLELTDALPMEVEHQGGTVGTYSISSGAVVGEQVTLILASKQTACLAPDRCGLPTLPQAADSTCCGNEGCC